MGNSVFQGTWWLSSDCLCRWSEDGRAPVTILRMHKKKERSVILTMQTYDRFVDISKFINKILTFFNIFFSNYLIIKDKFFQVTSNHIPYTRAILYIAKIDVVDGVNRL